MKTIAMDYDNTYTADPAFYRAAIDLAILHGHRVVCVTGRSDEGEWGAEVKRALGGVPVAGIVFAGRLFKRQAAEAAGYSVDWWWDDMPEYISRQVPELVAHKAVEK